MRAVYNVSYAKAVWKPPVNYRDTFCQMLCQVSPENDKNTLYTKMYQHEETKSP